MAPRPDTFIDELTEEGRQPPRTFRNPETEARRAELGVYYRATVARFRDMVTRARPNPPLGRLHPNRRLVLDRATGLPVAQTPPTGAAAVTTTTTATAVPATEGSGWDLEEIAAWDDRTMGWGHDTGRGSGWEDDSRTGWDAADDSRTGWDAAIAAFGRVASVAQELNPATREADNAWERALTHPDVQRIVRGLRDGARVAPTTRSSSAGSPPPLEEAVPWVDELQHEDAPPHVDESLPSREAASAAPAREGTPPPPREPTSPPSREPTPPPPVVGWGQRIESRAAFTDRTKAEFLTAQKACKIELCTRGIPCKDCAKLPGSAWFMIGETFIDECVDDADTDCGSVLSVTPPPTPGWYAMSRQHDFELFYRRQEEREGQRYPMF